MIRIKEKVQIYFKLQKLINIPCNLACRRLKYTGTLGLLRYSPNLYERGIHSYQKQDRNCTLSMHPCA